MRLRVTLTLAVVGTVAVLALLLSTREWGLGQAPSTGPAWPYLLEDVHDRGVYQQRGRWLPSGRTPYVEEHSEYPQLATWLFGLPYLFIDHHVPRDRDQTMAELRQDAPAYLDAHDVLMSFSFLALLVVTALGLRDLGASPGWTLLLFAPACAYFSFSRFDAWPAALVGGAFLCQFRGRRVAAAALLALGGMMKWYPILLLPLFLSHDLWGRQDGTDGTDRAPRGSPLARLPSAVLLPGAVAGLACLSILAITFFWDGGGLEAVLHPYRHHEDRDPNAASLVFALTGPGRWGLFGLADQAWLSRVGTALQFLPALGLALVPVRSREALVAGCLAVVTGFVMFGKVFSPQWVVWVAPLAILLGSRRPGGFAFALALGILVWVQMPLLYYGAQASPGDAALQSAYLRASDVRIVAFLALWAWSLARFLRTFVRDRRDLSGAGRAVAVPVPSPPPGTA